MSWHFGIARPNEEEQGALRRFAMAHGSRRDGPLDQAWWAEAADPKDVIPRGMGGSYESAGALPDVLVQLVDHWLRVEEWRSAGRSAPAEDTTPAADTAPARVLVVPFAFQTDHDAARGVTELSLEDGTRHLIADPTRLLDHWPGKEDPTYDSRSAAAWRRLRSGDVSLLTDDDDETRAQLQLGLHRWLHEMARAAWDARVCWTVSW